MYIYTHLHAHVHVHVQVIMTSEILHRLTEQILKVFEHVDDTIARVGRCLFPRPRIAQNKKSWEVLRILQDFLQILSGIREEFFKNFQGGEIDNYPGVILALLFLVQPSFRTSKRPVKPRTILIANILVCDALIAVSTLTMFVLKYYQLTDIGMNNSRLSLENHERRMTLLCDQRIVSWWVNMIRYLTFIVAIPVNLSDVKDSIFPNLEKS